MAAFSTTFAPGSYEIGSFGHDHQSSLAETLLVHDGETPAPERPLQKARIARWTERVGWYGNLLLACGTLGVAASLIFLCFLWTGNSNNTVWHNIVTSGWLTRSVTIAALVIRLAVAGQASIGTSMIAALALQRHGVALPSVVGVALARVHNIAPHWLAYLMLPTSKKGVDIALLLSLSVLVLTTLGSQFTSTILLSGLQIGVTEGNIARSSSSYGSRGFPELTFSGSANNYWVSNPLEYPSFAEYSETPAQIEGVHDTGMAMRALLPVSSTPQREMLKEYHGKATVVNSRVVCTRPTLEDLSFHGTEGVAPVIRGQVGTIIQAEGLGTWCNESCRSALPYNQIPSPGPLSPFSCSSATATAPGYAPWDGELPIVVCPVSSWTGLLSPFWPVTRFDEINLEDPGPYEEAFSYGQSYLVIQTTGSAVAWTALGHTEGVVNGSINGTLPRAYEDLKLRESIADEEWLILPVATNYSDVSIKMSLCFTNFDTRDMAVQASRTSNHTEAVLAWNAQNSSFDTDAIRRQLGATLEPVSVEERGLLRMQPQADWSKPEGGIEPIWNATYEGGQQTPPNGTQQNILPLITTNIRYDAYGPEMPVQTWTTQNMSILMCVYCYADDYGAAVFGDALFNYTYINHEQASIFNDIIKDTNHPALALQAHLTTQYGSAYYDISPQFDVEAAVNQTSFVQVLKPTDARPLIAVCVLCIVHLLLMAFISILFQRSGTLSLLGNAWDAVAQLRRNDKILSYLEIAEGTTDRELAQLMREDGVDRALVTLEDGGSGSWHWNTRGPEQMKAKSKKSGCQSSDVGLSTGSRQGDVGHRGKNGWQRWSE